MPDQRERGGSLAAGEELQAAKGELRLGKGGWFGLGLPASVPAQGRSLEPFWGEPGEEVAELKRVLEVQPAELAGGGVGFEQVAAVDRGSECVTDNQARPG